VPRDEPGQRCAAAIRCDVVSCRRRRVGTGDKSLSSGRGGAYNQVAMTRGLFLKGCASGMCSCAAGALVTREAAGAQAESPELGALKGKVDACQVRFAKLVGILNGAMEPPARKMIFESLGRECARQYRDLTGKYTNDVKGFLAMAGKQWVEKAEYDEKAGTIRVVDKGPHCSCPLVKDGRPVEAELEESILRGGRCCVFRIRIA